VRRPGIAIAGYAGDRGYHELVDARRAAAWPAARPVPADDPLLVVHLANRRGRPTGIVHRTAGFLAYASTLHRRALSTSIDDVFWVMYGDSYMDIDYRAVLAEVPLAGEDGFFLGVSLLDLQTQRDDP
jgi:acyl-coenzyme A synthetase/AMP-(fatty) acid ligase